MTSPAGATARVEQLAVLGRLDEAERRARDALTDHPGDAGLLAALAHVLLRDQRYADGLAAAQAAVAADPESDRPHRLCGILLSYLGRHHEATFAVHHALMLAPQEPAVAVGYSLVLQRAGRLQDALDVARRAVALNPEWAHAQHRLANAALARGDRVTARAALAEALRLDPDDAAARHDLALVDLHDRHAGAALRGFAEAGRMSPELGGTALANMAVVLWRLAWRLRLVLIVATFALIGASDGGPVALRVVGGIAVVAVAAAVAWQLRPLRRADRRAVRAALRSDGALTITAGVLVVTVACVLAVAVTGSLGLVVALWPLLILLAVVALVRRARRR
jgi:tetratricopeptide (TPR) repeat protein